MMLLLVNLVVRLLDSLRHFGGIAMWGLGGGGWVDISDRSGRIPDHRYSHGAVAFEGGLLVTHGYYFDHVNRAPQWLNDTWWLAFDHEQWYRVRVETPGPSARFRASLVAHDGALFLFGGDDGGQPDAPSYVWGRHFNDLWKFDDGEWTALTTLGASPPPLQAHTAVVLGHSMLVFGGLKSHGTSATDNDVTADSDDVWALDLRTLRWTLLATGGGVRPPARHSHAAVAMGYEMAVFGGFHKAPRGLGNLNDLWIFDPLRGDWELVQPADGVSPTPRGAAAAAADPLRPVMYVFGGAACHGGCQCTSDLWQFSRATNTWKEIKPPGPQPTNRHFHSLSVSPDRVLYVFGGESYDPYMYFNDVWKFDLKPLDPRDASPFKALPPAPPPLTSPVSFGTIPGYPLLQPRSDSQVMLLKILLGGVVVAFFSTAVKSLLHRGPDRRSPGGAAGPSPAAPTVGVPPKPKTQ